ncbi:MAG: type IX secretion system protein PorQ, partial [Tannerella sp.]|nr:type IX secretion system protein PorQ [Tannerella sp.]
MKYLKLLIYCCLPACIFAQDGNDAYSFLRLPTSAHISALGGYNVSMVELDPSTVFYNPALLGGEMDGMINVNYLNYISDVNLGSAIFTKAFKERGSIGVGATYINYGKMQETSPENVIIGTFSAQDMSLQAFYAYDLTDKWRGGLSLKALYSVLADYYSFGLAVDAGLSYFDTEKDFSFGLALKNIGAQLKAYDIERQKVPWDIQMGFTKRLAHAPIRISATGMYLNRWKLDYLDKSTTEKKESFIQTAVKHLVLGIDFVPSENFWIG